MTKKGWWIQAALGIALLIAGTVMLLNHYILTGASLYFVGFAIYPTATTPTKIDEMTDLRQQLEQCRKNKEER